MNATVRSQKDRITLHADTAADMMTPNPLSLRESATLQEAVAFLTDKGFSAAPVIDRAGRPVGVLSRADVLVYDREKSTRAVRVPEYYSRSDLTLGSGEDLTDGFEVQIPDQTWVTDVMTPVVFSVTPDAAAGRVIRDMLAWKVHRVFVVDPSGVLVGVISALDVLRYLS
jgi:CBS domain-containing protein